MKLLYTLAIMFIMVLTSSPLIAYRGEGGGGADRNRAQQQERMRQYQNRGGTRGYPAAGGNAAVRGGAYERGVNAGAATAPNTGTQVIVEPGVAPIPPAPYPQH